MNLEQSLAYAYRDDGAFRSIYEATIDRVYGFVLMRVGDPDTALDICQDIYLSLWKSLAKFRYMSEPQFYGYLFKIARRTLSRSRTKTPHEASLYEIYEFPSDDGLIEDYRQLLKRIRGLNENERLCIELRYFEDLKFQDVAEVMGISENYAKVLHHRAINALRKDSDLYA